MTTVEIYIGEDGAYIEKWRAIGKAMTRQEVVDIVRGYILGNPYGFNEFRDRYRFKRLGLMGSVARDQMRVDSDVDILVEVYPNIGSLEMLHIMTGMKKELEELLHCPVDVLAWSPNITVFWHKEFWDGYARKIANGEIYWVIP